MRALATLLSILFVTVANVAQAPAEIDQPSEFEVLKYSWAKVRVDWDKIPFGRPTQISDTRSRRGSILEERQARESAKDKDKPTEPPRYVFQYKVTLLNSGSKEIKEVDWDYIFTDANGAELGRREFTSVEKIGAGKRKELIVVVSAAPARRISVYTLGKNEPDGLVERVVIRRLLYDDGSSWQIPDATNATPLSDHLN